MYLFERIEGAKSFGAYKEIPKLIPDNLNSNFSLREYQINAFRNFITYFENDKLCQYPTQTLFHMATGSGKTLIMAGLMIYLYNKGYRNFLFFVNLDNIVKKTEVNFLDNTSPKFLFSNELNIDGQRIKIRKVSNFQDSDDNAINICFTTTQGLHSNMWTSKENSMTYDDFSDKKVVFISDEAHHLNADTKKGGKLDDSTISWEYTVNRIFRANSKNILLEFTATCDLKNKFIKIAYEDKIIFDYPLKNFRQDGFSKEVKTLQADIPLMERAIQAILLSQYRLKVFQDKRIFVKPVVLFKHRTISEIKEFRELFTSSITKLNGKTLEMIAKKTEHPTLDRMYQYFDNNGISFDQLAQELKEDFGPEHCISVNDEKEAEINQIIVNTLEDKDNPYRAVFEVKKLDEGWDVLNLFDIVRLYETRDAKSGKPGPATVAEAQLIGRGARYCPFNLTDDDERYKRKFDQDLDNEMRVCEELYYHCHYDSRYINELTIALKEIGILPEGVIVHDHNLKEEFKTDDLYLKGVVFANKKVTKNRSDVFSLLPSIRDKEYSHKVYTGAYTVDTVLDEEHSSGPSIRIIRKTITVKEISEINYNIVHRALRQYPRFKFDILKKYFPNLESTRQFITDGQYLGGIRIAIEGPEKEIEPREYYEACKHLISKIDDSLLKMDETHEGSKEFESAPIKDVFKDKRVNYSDPKNGGAGVSQNDISVPPDWRLDLSKEDWYAFSDNYGTSEEKAFVSYFKKNIVKLKLKYDEIYLIRNERQLKIFSFSDGERFEPDFLLFLRKKNGEHFDQFQIFIEPKGTHLIEGDKWKEEFLLDIEKQGKTVTRFFDDNQYFVWGFPFFNTSVRMKEFDEEMERLQK
jgi:type III restriction enzyme